MEVSGEMDDQGNVQDLLIEGQTVKNRAVLPKLFAVVRQYDEQGPIEYFLSFQASKNARDEVIDVIDAVVV
jgi:hypothetical protein